MQASANRRQPPTPQRDDLARQAGGGGMSRRLVLGAVWLIASAAAHAQTCEPTGVRVQVLGSGGPALHTQRAGSGYLVWIDGKARVLVDLGQGSAMRFGEAGATVADLDVVLFNHLHTAHSADLPALVHASLGEKRTRPLPIYGPSGNKFMPSTVTFVRDLFDSTRGAWRYLGDVINPLAKGTYKLEPHDVRERKAAPKIGMPRRNDDPLWPVFANERLRAVATEVGHGNAPALAWRIEAGGKAVVFAGDNDGTGTNLVTLARGADLLIAHHPVTESASAAELALHAPPGVIARVAKSAGARQLLLSHRSPATLGREEQTTAQVRAHYAGALNFANDLDCHTP
jgi:ribonuclease BN (tRNA processing enzyme)